MSDIDALFSTLTEKEEIFHSNHHLTTPVSKESLISDSPSAKFLITDIQKYFSMIGTNNFMARPDGSGKNSNSKNQYYELDKINGLENKYVKKIYLGRLFPSLLVSEVLWGFNMQPNAAIDRFK